MKSILNEIFRSIIKAEDFDYEANLRHAFHRNQLWGLKSPNFHTDRNYYIDQDVITKIIDKTIFCRPIYEIAGNCFPVCVELSERLNKELNIHTLVTVGYMIKNDVKGRIKKCFYGHEFFVKKRLDKKNVKISLHCWITLPNLLIIDPTIKSTENVILGKFEENYRLSFWLDGMQQSVNSIFAYQPIIVGSEFYHRLSMSRLPLF